MNDGAEGDTIRPPSGLSSRQAEARPALVEASRQKCCSRKQVSTLVAGWHRPEGSFRRAGSQSRVSCPRLVTLLSLGFGSVIRFVLHDLNKDQPSG
jgi:hypothetical protein